MSECPFCDPDSNMKTRIVEVKTLRLKNEPYVIVPREPAAFGHLLVVSRTHYEDLCDPKLNSEEGLAELFDMMKMIQLICSKIKTELKSPNKEYVEKVYVLTQCETPHLHFQLIPRYQGELSSNLFLFEKEMQESRWMLDEDNEEKTNINGYTRIGQGMGVLNYHSDLLESNKWAKSNASRIDYINNVKKEIEKIL